MPVLASLDPGLTAPAVPAVVSAAPAAAAPARGPLPAAPAESTPPEPAEPEVGVVAPDSAAAPDPARAMLPLLAAGVGADVVGRAAMPDPATGCVAVGRLPALPDAAAVMLCPASAYSLEQAASGKAANISARRALRIDISCSCRRCTHRREVALSCVTQRRSASSLNRASSYVSPHRCQQASLRWRSRRAHWPTCPAKVVSKTSSLRPSVRFSARLQRKAFARAA